MFGGYSQAKVHSERVVVNKFLKALLISHGWTRILQKQTGNGDARGQAEKGRQENCWRKGLTSDLALLAGERSRVKASLYVVVPDKVLYRPATQPARPLASKLEKRRSLGPPASAVWISFVAKSVKSRKDGAKEVSRPPPR